MNVEFVLWRDLLRLLIKVRKTLTRVAVWTALIVTVFVLKSPPQYVAKAVFKEGHATIDSSSHLHAFFQAVGGLSSQKTSIVSMMQSETVLRHAIETLGMQAVVEPASIWTSFIDTLAAEIRLMGQDRERWVFRGVKYLGDLPADYQICFLDEEQFVIRDTEKKEWGPWKLHEEIQLPLFRGALVHAPRHRNKRYQLTLLPWEDVVKAVAKKLAIRPASKSDSSLFHLYYRNPDRHLAAEFLNQVMQSFRHMLYQENEQIVADQLRYLNRRKKELMIEWDQALAEHAEYLADNMRTGGGLNVTQEIEALQKPYQNYAWRLMEIDLELHRLNARDSALPEREAKGVFIAHELSRLKTIQQEAEKALDRMKKGEVLCDPKLLTSIWGTEVQKVLEDTHLISFLEKNECKIKTLEENKALCEASSNAFTGLSLPVAQQLFAEYHQKKEQGNTQLKQLVHLSEQLYQPYFELSAISTLLSDSVTERLVVQAGETAVCLQDASNRSSREQSYLQETLLTQKNFLAQHLGQIIELTKLRVALIDDQIAALRSAISDLLIQEKHLLEEQIGHLKNRMGMLPEKWRKENQLLLHKEMGIHMMEGLAQLAEAKNVDRHLYHVGSKPLDGAQVPKRPAYPGLFFYPLAGGILSALIVYAGFFIVAVMKGFPVSHERLLRAGWNSLGTLSHDSDLPLSELKSCDLEVLRQVAQRITTSSSKFIWIVGGELPDFTLALAELLALQQRQVLVVRFIFDEQVAPQESPGLLQYLQGEVSDLPLRACSVYAELLSGGASRYGCEWLGHPRFKQFLLEVQSRFTHVLIYTHAKPSDAEAKAISAMDGELFLVVQKESFLDLSSYLPERQAQGRSAPSFVVYS